MVEILNVEHKKRFNQLLGKASVCEGDLERYALFFIISGNADLYRKVNYIYNFEDGGGILPEIFDNSEVDLCGSSKTLIKLAFNLYNGYKSDLTVLNTFLSFWIIPTLS